MKKAKWDNGSSAWDNFTYCHKRQEPLGGIFFYTEISVVVKGGRSKEWTRKISDPATCN